MKQLLATTAALAFFMTAAQACPLGMKSAEHVSTMTTASILPGDGQKPQMSVPQDASAYEPEFDEDEPAEADIAE
jgi:hypothetical protein